MIKTRLINCLIPSFFIFSLLLCRLSSSMAYGAEFYIATDGSDAHNNGSIEFPWATIKHAADNSEPGDTVYVRGGTYNENIWIRSDHGHGGNQEHYWTLKPYQDEIVTFDIDVHFKLAAPYVIIEKFYFKKKGISLITGGGYCCPYPGGAHHVIIRNNHFSGQGFRYSAISVYGQDNIIENNTIEDIIQSNSTDHGIYLHHGEHNIIRNNYIADARGAGIHIYTEYKESNAGEDLTIRDMLIEGNIITNTGSAGIIVATGTNNSPLVKNNIILNNVIFDCGWSSGDHGIDLRGKSEDIYVYNNTIYNHTPLTQDDDSGIHIGKHSNEDKTISNVFIKNNIIDVDVSEEDDYHVAISNEAVIYDFFLEKNLYWPAPMKLDDIPDDSPVLGDPQFENPTAGDFHLKSTSAAIDVGLAISEVTNDKDGITRPIGSGYDIGAYEHIDCTEDPDHDNDNYNSIECGGDDCDDTDPEFNPGADEICEDLIDNDCDGLIDEDCIVNINADCTDFDYDGFYIEEECGEVDCDDKDPLIYPDAEEICDDEIDNDCDELIDLDDEDCTNEDTEDSNDELDDETGSQTSESIIDKDENIDVHGCGITTNIIIKKYNFVLNILFVLVVFVMMGMVRKKSQD